MELDITYVLMKDDFPQQRVIEIKEDFGIVKILDQNIMMNILESECVDISACLLVKKVIDKEVPLYILFTSGSTGRPKGVVIMREAFRCLDSSQASYSNHVAENTNLLQVTEFTFDIFLIDFLVF
jgi:D-alanine--poly(phosphoribitol) ligase subunit 1